MPVSKLWFVVALVSVWALINAVPTTDAHAETIRLRSDAWCPVNCEPGSAKPGYMIEIAQEVFAEHGIAVDYQLMPWARVLEEVLVGRIEGAVGASINPRRGLVFGAEPLGEAGVVIAVRADDPFIYAGPASLESRRLGVVRDYSYDGGELDAYVQAQSADFNRIVMVAAEDVSDRLVRLLISGRVGAIAESRPVLAYHAGRVGASDGYRIAGYLPPDYISIGFSPALAGSRRWADLLSDGVVKLRKSGRLQQILATYGLTDFAPPQ